MLPEDLTTRLNRLRLLAMDVDGTLTDGGVYMLADGQEFRRFDIKDGLGLKAVMGAGIRILWLSAASSASALHRARKLGIQDAFFGVQDKAAFLEQFCQEQNIPLESVAYIGDDLTDLQIMRRVGAAFAPCDAASLVRQAAGYVTRARGGFGAVREVCDLVLASLAS
jgi:3-deoxy-D-manno-octulosonate 8-phosphate phosphatase (KDO 8-P phosphatase)